MIIDINEEYKHMNWENVVGNEKSVRLLQNMEEVPQVGLFSGPIGCGKNLLAYLLYKKVAETGDTYLSVRDSADSTAKTALEMIEQLKSVPLGYKNSVAILNEFHLFQKPAQRKFLDLLQSPPHSVFLFIVSLEPKLIIDDIRSRCKFHIRVRELSDTEMYQLVSNISHYYNLTSLRKKTKMVIATACNGIPRKAINVIQSLAAMKEFDNDTIASLLAYSDTEGQEGTAFYTIYKIATSVLDGGRAYNRIAKLPKLIEETNLSPEVIQYKMLHMCYKNYSGKKKIALMRELVPKLQTGREKFDLLDRLGRVILG